MTPRPGSQREISLHRVLADWGEGSSRASQGEAGGAQAAAGDATWLHTFFPNSTWASAGGDFVQSSSALTSVGNNGPYQWSTPQMVADVQAWLDDPSSNFGWLLRGQETLGNATATAKRFHSRHATSDLRPQLTVEYTPAQQQDPEPSLIFPQFANGDVPSALMSPAQVEATLNTTRLILRNNGDETVEGRVLFRDATGQPLTVPIGGEETASVAFSLSANTVLDLSTDGTGLLKTGVAVVVVDSGNANKLEGTLIFSLLGNFVSVDSSPVRPNNQIYVARNSEENTGIAAYNPSAATATQIEFQLADNEGNVVATKTIVLAAQQQFLVFVDERKGDDTEELFPDYFEQNPGPFNGTINARTVQQGGSPVGPDAVILGLIQKLPGGALIAVASSPNAFFSTP